MDLVIQGLDLVDLVGSDFTLAVVLPLVLALTGRFDLRVHRFRLRLWGLWFPSFATKTDLLRLSHRLN